MGRDVGWICAQRASLAFSISILIAAVMAGYGASWGEARAEFRTAFADRLPYIDTSFGEQVRQEMALPAEFVAVSSFANEQELNAVWASFWILQEGRFDLHEGPEPGPKTRLIVPQLGSEVIAVGEDSSGYLKYVIENLVEVQRSPVRERESRRAYWNGHTFLEAGFFKAPLVLQVATLVHEARHGEGVLKRIDPEGFAHGECKFGPNRGEELCDISLRSGGAYAAEFEYLARVANQGKNFHPVYQSLARLAAIEYAHTKFEQAEIGPKSTMAALTEDNRLLVLENGEWFERASMSVPGDLVRRQSNAAILPVLPFAREVQPWFVDIYAYSPVAGLESFAELLQEQSLLHLHKQPLSERASMVALGEFAVSGKLMEWQLFAKELRFRRKGSVEWCRVKNKTSVEWEAIVANLPNGERLPHLVAKDGSLNRIADLWLWFTVQDCHIGLNEAVQTAFAAARRGALPRRR